MKREETFSVEELMHWRNMEGVIAFFRNNERIIQEKMEARADRQKKNSTHTKEFHIRPL